MKKFYSNNKNDSTYEEIEEIYEEKRINKLKTKIYSEQFFLIYIITCIYFLYTLIILKEPSWIILLIIISNIYEDFRLAYNKAYVSNKFSKFIIVVASFCGIDYIYHKITIRNPNLMVTAIITLIVSLIYIFILRCCNDRVKK